MRASGVLRIPSQGAQREPDLLRGKSRGGARLKSLIWLLILVAGAYAAYKVVPAYFANYELQDKMQTEARFAVVNRRSDSEIGDVILRECKARDIPVRREDIRVESGAGRVRISVDYMVTVDLLVYQLQMHFTPTADSRAL